MNVKVELKVYGGVDLCADELTLDWASYWLYIDYCSPSGDYLGTQSCIYGDNDVVDSDGLGFWKI